METIVLILALTGVGLAFVSWKASHWSNLVSGLFAFAVFGLSFTVPTIGLFTASMYLVIGILGTALWIMGRRKKKFDRMYENETGQGTI